MSAATDDEAREDPDAPHAPSPPKAPPNSDFSYFLGLGIVAISFIAMMCWTWRTWPDPIIDFGRELYLAWQVSEGATLYRDVEHFNGPLSVHFNALVFKIFGVSLMTLAITNIVIAAAIAWLIYDLVWRATEKNVFAATSAGVVFSTMFAFAQYVPVGNYNYATPYSHELTHGILLTLCAIAAIVRAFDPGRCPIRWLFIAGIATGLLLLTKPEPIIAGGAAIFVGVTMVLRKKPRTAAAFGFAAALIAIVAIACLAFPPSRIIGGFRYIFDEQLTSMPFYRRVFGSDDVSGNVSRMIASAFALLFCWMSAGLFAVVPFSRANAGPRRREAMIVAAILPPAMVFSFGPFFPWAMAFRGVAVLVAAALIWMIVLIARRGVSCTMFTRLLCTLFAALLLLKIALAASAQHYGFALAMPAIVVFVVALLSWRDGPGREARRGNACAARSFGLATVAVIVFVHLGQQKRFVDGKTIRIDANGNSFFALAESKNGPSHGAALERFLSAARTIVPPDATLAAMPEGAMINYLLRRKNPTPFITLLPPEFVMFGGDRIAAAYRSNPPDFIVIVPTDVEQYGSAGFSQDYGREIATWVAENYERVETTASESYPLQLWKKKS